MCFTYTGTSDIWAEIYRKARKSHHCTGCDRGIKTGDWYWYGSSLFDGKWRHTNECEACRYHRSLIYAIERSEGCGMQVSWVPLEALADELVDRGWHVGAWTDEKEAVCMVS